VNFITHFWDRDAKSLKLDPADEIVKQCVLTQDGSILREDLLQPRTEN
jgi:hypothetical protein